MQVHLKKFMYLHTEVNTGRSGVTHYGDNKYIVLDGSIDIDDDHKRQLVLSNVRTQAVNTLQRSHLQRLFNFYGK